MLGVRTSLVLGMLVARPMFRYELVALGKQAAQDPARLAELAVDHVFQDVSALTVALRQMADDPALIDVQLERLRELGYIDGVADPDGDTLWSCRPSIEWPAPS